MRGRYNIWYSSESLKKFNILARTDEGAAIEEGILFSAIGDGMKFRFEAAR